MQKYIDGIEARRNESALRKKSNKNHCEITELIKIKRETKQASKKKDEYERWRGSEVRGEKDSLREERRTSTHARHREQ